MIVGAVAVTAISFFCIPHWSAAFFVFPMVSILYVNLLGTLQCFGLHINGLTYVCVVVSIGLLVDFLMHILMKYYESLEASPEKTRNERVQETLETMGVSVMVGGFTTFLGVLPATISTAKIFTDICLSFVAIVLLGLTHGLILLPVMLSLVGPTVPWSIEEESSDKQDDALVEAPTMDLTMALSGPMDTNLNLFTDDSSEHAAQNEVESPKSQVSDISC